MIVPFIYHLRARGLPVGTQEAIALAHALTHELHDSSLDGFYHLARAILVHREGDLDDFDIAFAEHFRGVEAAGVQLHKELLDWLEDARNNAPQLTDEQRAALEQYDLEELKRMFEERLAEQKERHDGGNKWIGTGGTSPFGHSGAAREGIRVGGPGGNRSAVQVADARRYRGYRSDLTLDVRQMSVALRRLRAFVRDGAIEELDIEGTIDATAKNAGELEIITRPPERSNTRVILMMDVGGSMDPYAHLMSRLFTAAKKATHFKELRTYYFHNCVYGEVYHTDKFDDPIRVTDIFKDCGPHYKLIVLGDALMAPYELLSSAGSLDLGDDNRVEGIAWLMRLADHFDRSCWLNPEPPRYWFNNTIEYIGQVFEMFPLTLEGLGEAVKHLTRGAPTR